MAVNCLLLDDTPGAHKELANEIAWWLATSHIDEIRSPSLAMSLEPKLGDWWEHVDTQAAIHAANGNYEKAVELQEQAITLLKADDAHAVFLENNGLDAKNGMLRLAMLIRGHSPQARLSDFQKRKVLYQKRRPYLDVVENEATAATTDDERD